MSHLPETHQQHYGYLNPPRLGGFTLVEMMVAIAVLAILFSIVLPSFSDMTLGSKLRTQIMELQAGATLARSEAIKRNRPVTFCASVNGTACSGSEEDWSDGWVILAQNGDLIQAGRATAEGFLLESAVASFVFSPDGASGSAGSLRLCRFKPSAGSQERVLTITAPGRSSVGKTNEGTCAP